MTQLILFDKEMTLLFLFMGLLFIVVRNRAERSMSSYLIPM